MDIRRLVGYLTDGVVPNAMALDANIASVSRKEQALDVILEILKGDVPTGVEVEDGALHGPKNETLAKHREHCTAKEGNCPFEREMDKTDEIPEDRSVSDLVDYYAKFRSTNASNPDCAHGEGRFLDRTGEHLFCTPTIDGRMVMVDTEGYSVTRDRDNKPLYFDDPSDAVRWGRERGCDIEVDERKTFNGESVGDAGTGLIRKYLETCQDGLPQTLERHDRRFHDGHFDPETMKCKFREEMAKSDDVDALVERQERSLAGLSNNKASEYLRLMKKKCPNLDPEETLKNIASIGDRKMQGDAFRWLMKGAIRLPEDLDKVIAARKVADKVKTDPFKYDTPQMCVNANSKMDRGDGRYIDPDTVPELTNKREMGHGIAIYDVQDDRQGQQAMRRILNSHLGKDEEGNYMSPWCLLHDDGRGGLSSDAWGYWHDTYNALPKKVAFKDGKVCAFMATDNDDTSEEDEAAYREYLADSVYGQGVMSFKSFIHTYGHSDPKEEWWDLNDEPHERIPIGKVRIPNDPEGRSQDAEVDSKGIHLTGNISRGEVGKPGYKEWNKDGRVVKSVDAGGTTVSDSYGSYHVENAFGGENEFIFSPKDGRLVYAKTKVGEEKTPFSSYFARDGRTDSVEIGHFRITRDYTPTLRGITVYDRSTAPWTEYTYTEEWEPKSSRVYDDLRNVQNPSKSGEGRPTKEQMERNARLYADMFRDIDSSPIVESVKAEAKRVRDEWLNNKDFPIGERA